MAHNLTGEPAQALQGTPRTPLLVLVKIQHAPQNFWEFNAPSIRCNFPQSSHNDILKMSCVSDFLRMVCFRNQNVPLESKKMSHARSVLNTRYSCLKCFKCSSSGHILARVFGQARVSRSMFLSRLKLPGLKNSESLDQIGWGGCRIDPRKPRHKNRAKNQQKHKKGGKHKPAKKDTPPPRIRPAVPRTSANACVQLRGAKHLKSRGSFGRMRRIAMPTSKNHQWLNPPTRGESCGRKTSRQLHRPWKMVGSEGPPERRKKPGWLKLWGGGGFIFCTPLLSKQNRLSNNPRKDNEEEIDACWL